MWDLGIVERSLTTMRPGIIDLRDLAHRYMWDARAIAPFVGVLGLEVAGEPASRGFTPPRVLVVIVPHDGARLLERSRPWLAECAHLVVVRDGHKDPVE